MKKLILLVLIIFIAVSLYYIFIAVSLYYYASQDVILPAKEQTSSTKITQQQALEKVKSLTEVQQYLKDVPNGKVEMDNELDGEYNVHVYEIKDGHTATFNWYRVNMETGQIKAEISY